MVSPVNHDYPYSTTDTIEIVPILPDTLISRAGVPEEHGKRYSPLLYRSEYVLNPSLVQRWVSVLLAAYGGFLMLGSRKTRFLPSRVESVL